MSFDQKTRNLLQRTVSACRKILDEEFAAQRREIYGINDDGTAAPLETLAHLPDEDMQVARLLRDRLQHLSAGLTAHGKKETEARRESVARLTREQAFTVLNRLAALRMAEEREIVLECVRQGMASEGFLLFQQTAGSALGSTFETYRSYLFLLFDELTSDLGVLFSRWDPAALMFPGKDALEAVLKELGGTGTAMAREVISPEEFSAIWSEDETIGWIYQYYNDQAERKKMRDESAAPRNSRELAVRNQFFTPRYVVEFLTDNTLGRIWYEMTQGDTTLKEQCRYLVRRPNEIFLASGETPPAENKEQSTKNEELSQEDLLKQPVHIPHRPLKDPRTILMLDPACGSMHFGLYAFDLFEVIYDEAWALEEKVGADALSRPTGMKFLHDTYTSKDAFLKDVPRLIIEHNLHGIDIDPRCAQIAGLSLWLRAQKAWQRLGLAPADRPAIKRSNIVCAEPMPGEKELLREFVEREFPAEERGVCLRLLEAIFDKMQLAGEAGSLLKIEEEIRSAIEDARDAWQKIATKPLELFTTTELNQLSTAPELNGLEQAVSSLTTDPRHLTTNFWERIEERLYAALRDYAEQAENGGGFQRRLFAEDAARGFAFIDVCRKRYDVALMNPPFGELSRGAKTYLFGAYPLTKNDLFACFTERWAYRANLGGRVGAITSRSGFFFSSFQAWREEVLLAYAKPVVLADLGYGVLDSAMVETAAYILEVGRADHPLLCFRLLEEENKSERLSDVTGLLNTGKCDPLLHVCAPSEFRRIPGAPFAYWVGERVLKLFADFRPFAGQGRKAAGGIGTTDDFRFIRCWWEVPPTNFATSKAKASSAHAFVPIALGGQTSRFYAATTATVKFGRDGLELKTFIEDKLGRASRNVRGQEFYFRPGLTWPLRGELFSAWPVPAGCVFSVAGKIATTENEAELPYLLGLFNSLPFDFLVGLSAGKVGGIRIQHQSGLIDRIPFRECTTAGQALALMATNAWGIKWRLDTSELRSHAFTLPALLQITRAGLNTSATRWAEQVARGRDQIKTIQAQIDVTALGIYGLEAADVRQQQPKLHVAELPSDVDADSELPEEVDEVGEIRDISSAVASLVDYLTGSAFGRWDIRYATGEQAAPELPDPFAPLPVCPPGQLQNAQGLPVEKAESGKLKAENYPIEIPWDGILVDDPNHPLDIERRVREVIEIIWSGKEGGPTAEAIEHEACEILGVKSLRDYFRKPAGFFADHLKRYSKSRRQAPIYWPLSTASGSYTLWIYYHRLTPDTLYKCLQDFVEPKIAELEKDLHRLRTMVAAEEAGTRERNQLAEAESLLDELRALHADLTRWAPRWKPNLNDGVQITASPLWKLFLLPKWQKTLKETWQTLEKGDYDWAHLAYSLWPDRVREKCKKDRSLAIAHNLEDLCEIQAPVPKKRGAKKAAKKKGEDDNQPELIEEG